MRTLCLDIIFIHKLHVKNIFKSPLKVVNPFFVVVVGEGRVRGVKFAFKVIFFKYKTLHI